MLFFVPDDDVQIGRGDTRDLPPRLFIHLMLQPTLLQPVQAKPVLHAH